METPQEHHALILAAGSSRRLRARTAERPKCLLEVGGKALIEHSLDALAARGVRRLTLVVGYLRERLISALGERHGPIGIDYVVNEDYATTEHGWSLYCTRESWARHGLPVLFLDADDLYHPALLDRVLAGPPDVVLVDRRGAQAADEDELVLGESGRVTGLRRGRPAEWPGCVGTFVGVNRFSPAFMEALYPFMASLFERAGRSAKYERVFDALVVGGSARLGYLDVAGLPWVNVNDEGDLERARALAASTHFG